VIKGVISSRFSKQLKKPPDFSGGFFSVLLMLAMTPAAGDIFSADQEG
jgi:hypothetical protein